MSKYHVVLHYDASGEVDVEAEDGEEAEQLAFQILRGSGDNWDDSYWTCESCEEI